MTFGEQVDEATADRMLALFLERGYREIDTAHKYTGGASEEILGRLLTPERRSRVFLATKAHPLGVGALAPEPLARQVETSLQRLRTDHVDLLYLHAPDAKTAIESTLEACDELFRAGKFRELGLSNYAAWQVADICHLCGRNGWVVPSVYQGRYNAITRDVEGELFPALRRFGLRFYAYNPLAGGFLTGRYRQIDEPPKEGRFVIKSSYRERFWNRSYFDALEVLREAAAREDLAMVPVALRWLLRHSRLKGACGDGVILSASSLAQWENNLDSLGGDLPEGLREAADRAWDRARQDCPSYFKE
jgi:aflatoxin B1 aldehyde reductase